MLKNFRKKYKITCMLVKIVFATVGASERIKMLSSTFTISHDRVFMKMKAKFSLSWESLNRSKNQNRSTFLMISKSYCIINVKKVFKLTICFRLINPVTPEFPVRTALALRKTFGAGLFLF